MSADRKSSDSQRIDRLWGETFDATWVITTKGAEDRVGRLIASVPFSAERLTLDTCEPGFDPLERRRQDNHHVLVGNRHKRVLRAARRAGHRTVFVLEDDAEFLPGCEEKLERVLSWLRRHPAAWDVFYLGFLPPFLTRAAWRNRDIVRLTRPLQTHAIAYRGAALDRIEALDFRKDHRPWLFRTLESWLTPSGRREPYFRDGVGSIDTWLSYSRLRRLGSYPMLVVQSRLPPGTEENWKRRTGREYDYRRTPNEMLKISLFTHYAAAALLALTLAAVAIAVLSG